MSVSGSDAWDGSSPTHQAESKVGPWKTIKHAQYEIRKQRPEYPDKDSAAVLNLLSGVYYQSEPIYLDHHESFLTIKAFNDDPVTISGGQVLEPDEGWIQEDTIKTAFFKDTTSCGELFVGDLRLLPARDPDLPSWDFNMNTAGEPYHHVKDILEPSETCFMRQEGRNSDCPESNRNGFIADAEFNGLTDLEQTYVLVFHSWIAEYVRVANVTANDDGTSTILFQTPLKHAPVGEYNVESEWRYLIFNNKEFLNKPGESHCLMKDGGIEVSYIPKSSDAEENPIIAQTSVIFQLSQQNANKPRPRSVTISGIKFQHSSSNGVDGYNWGSESAIRILWSDDVSIEDCEFSHLGMMGIFTKNVKRLEVKNNLFFDLGYHGIMTFDAEDNRDGPYENILVSNNLFDGCGLTRFWQPACVWVNSQKNSTVIHNEVTNVPNHGIRLGGKPESKSYWNETVINPSRDDYIRHAEYNHVHHYGGILSDYGGIYAGPGYQCDGLSVSELEEHCFTYNHVFNNYIHDGDAFSGRPVMIYTDASGCKNTIENNLLVGDAGIWLYHHCGVENESKNNLIHRKSGNFGSAMWGGCEKNNAARHQKYANHHNIYLLDNVDNFLTYRPFDKYEVEPPTFHDNLYWSTQLDIEELQTMKVFPIKKDWNQWTSEGNDASSKWIDPMFVDLENGDYSFSPDSPALEMGIEPIEVNNFGVQPNKERLRYHDSLSSLYKN